MFMGDRSMLEVLLKNEFPINCQENGGSPVMHNVLHEAGIFEIKPNDLRSRCRDWQDFRTDIEWLTGLGARWIGRNRDDYRHVRDALLSIGEAGTKEILGIMLEGGSLTKGELRQILSTPRMKPVAWILGR